MSKLTESFRAVGVFNLHNFANGQPFIYYESTRGRGHNFQGWKVTKSGLDLGSAWYDHGAKTFSLYSFPGPIREAKAAALKAAQAWASDRFGVADWARDPYGGYQPASHVVSRTAELKRAVADLHVAASASGVGGPAAGRDTP